MFEYPLSTTATFHSNNNRHHLHQSHRDFSRFPPLLTGATAVAAATSLQTFSGGLRPFAQVAFASSSASPTASTTEGFLPVIEATRRGSTTHRRSPPKRENSGKRLLRKPNDNSRASLFKVSKAIPIIDTADLPSTMTAPMFSVRQCPRYEKRVAAPPSIGNRRSFETLFPNVRSLLKPELRKGRVIETTASSSKTPQPFKPSTCVRVPSLPSTLEGVFKLPSYVNHVKQERSRDTPSSSSSSPHKKPAKPNNKTPPSPSFATSNAAKSTATDSFNADARPRPSTSSSRRPKDYRPTSRKGAKSRRKKRKPTTGKRDENNNNGLGHVIDHNATQNSLKNKRISPSKDSSSVDSPKMTKRRNDNIAGRLNGAANANNNDEASSSVVKLLSRKLSGLGIYKKASLGLKSGEQSQLLRGSTDNEPSLGKRENIESRKENLPNHSPTSGLSIVGRRGKMETKSDQLPQPIILGKFTTSFSLAACLAKSNDGVNDGNNNGNREKDIESSNDGEYGASPLSTKTTMGQDSLKAKKEFESQLTTALTTTTKKSDEMAVKGSVNGGKNVKVYLSNKQTCDVRVEGGVMIPGAPPATPRDSYARYVDFVPAMSDIRSQRQLRNTLASMEQKQKAKAERLELAAKDADAERRKEAAVRLKAAQRREIYELNRIMEDLENQNFRQFCRNKGIELEL